MKIGAFNKRGNFGGNR